MSATGHTVNGFGIARVGAGVTDLALGCRFYEHLGFVAGPPFDLGIALGAQSETPGSPLVIQVMRREGVDLELVEHGGSRPPGVPPARRPMNQLGLTHLAFAVDDVDRVAAGIRDAGGSVLPHTRTEVLGGPAIGCADPFGIRLVLLGPGAATPFPALPGPDGIALAHLGATVADLGASTHFFERLGFQVGPTIERGTALAALVEVDDVVLTEQPVALGPYRIVLTQYGPPREPGPPVRLPLNRTGDLIHFGTHCDDFDAMLAVVRAAGGTVVERTRGQFPPPGLGMAWEGAPHGWVFVLDPNGVQIEIVGPRRAPTG